VGHNDVELAEDSAAEPEADVFYIYPTSNAGLYWNAPTLSQKSSFDRFWMEPQVSILKSGQVSAFAGACRIYAPEYREAHIAAFAFSRRRGREALDLAYSDVRKAFEHFLALSDRPFFIAGHSQGSLHAIRLLDELCREPAVQKRIIAAYLVGIRIPRSVVETLPVKEGIGPSDTGCIVGWDTMSTKCRNAWYYYLPTSPGFWSEGKWRDPELGPILSTNPLTWEPCGKSDGSAWKGMAMETIDYRPAAFVEHSADKALGVQVHHLERAYPVQPGDFFALATPRALIVPHMPVEKLGPLHIFAAINPGWYHAVDYALFHYNIQENVRVRLAAWKKRHPERIGSAVNTQRKGSLRSQVTWFLGFVRADTASKRPGMTRKLSLNSIS
jgi:pimeloyl-ACP methyl ester carboxylesterase